MFNIFKFKDKTSPVIENNKQEMGIIHENLTIDSPISKNRLFKRTALLCYALNKEGITQERKDSLMDELVSKIYKLRQLGYDLPRNTNDIPEALAKIANAGGNS